MRLPPARRPRYPSLCAATPSYEHSRHQSSIPERESSRALSTARPQRHRESYRSLEHVPRPCPCKSCRVASHAVQNRVQQLELPTQTTRLLQSRPHDRRLRWVVARMCKRRPRDVFLKIYDITEGRAARWLEPIIGVHVEGIWHTGLCCFDQEHFYCDGIQSMSSHLVELKFSMTLRDILYLGKTHEDKHSFHKFLRHNSTRFSPQKYDLIEWNCNHFTDLALRFLFPVPSYRKSSKTMLFAHYPPGRLPNFIVRQPQEFMSTVRGRLLIWMTRHVLEKVDNFLNQNFASGLDQIIARWLGSANTKNM